MAGAVRSPRVLRVGGRSHGVELDQVRGGLLVAALHHVGLAFRRFAHAEEVGTRISLRPSSEINQAVVRLSDVFNNISGDIDRDIAVAPAPGKSVAYDARVLIKLAEKFRLDWQPYSLSDKIVLTRASQRITQDMIRDAIVEKLKEKNINGKAEIQFDNRHLGVNLPMELGAVLMSISTIVVAANAQWLRRLDMRPERMPVA